MSDVVFVIVATGLLSGPLLVLLLWFASKRLPKPFRTGTFVVGATLIGTPSMIVAYDIVIPTTFIFLVINELFWNGLGGFRDVAQYLVASAWAFQVPAFAMTAALATLIAVPTYREHKPEPVPPARGSLRL